jgi:hypothetical protein
MSLVGGGLPQTVGHYHPQEQRHGRKLLVDVTAEVGTDEQITARVSDKGCGIAKSRGSNGEPPR